MSTKNKLTLNLPTAEELWKDDLFSSEESRADARRERVMEVPLAELHPFKDHPFHVRDDEELRELAQSIAENGVVTPAIARPRKEGGYELVAGHRRKVACELAGLPEMPVLIRDMDDDTATVVMVDSNKQRENLLPSEKAFAYKMRLDAMKRQGKRTDLTSAQVAPKLSTAQIGDEYGESKDQVKRYIRLTNLIPALLKEVDEKRIAFTPAVELSYLPKDTQQILLEAMQMQDCTPSLAQAVNLKSLHNEGKLKNEMIFQLLSQPKANQREKVSFSHEKLKQYFPKNYTAKQMEDNIIKLLEERQRKRQRAQNAER